MKAGYFDCPGVLAWCRRQHCATCGASPPVDPSHFPTRGAGGDDFGVAPLCRRCHRKAQEYREPFTREYQLRLSLETLLRFVMTADATEWASFVTSRERWAASRIFMEAF
jgi:hypothetical protein